MASVVTSDLLTRSVFCGGTLTAIFGILRCTFVLLNRPDGPELAGAWSCRESFVAVFISNLPILYPIVHRITKNLMTKAHTLSGSPSSGVIGDKTPNATNFKMSTLSRISRKKEKYKHPLSLPPETLYTRFGSEDEIVDKERMIMTETPQRDEEMSASLSQADPFPPVMVTRKFEIRQSFQEPSERENRPGVNSSMY